MFYSPDIGKCAFHFKKNEKGDTLFVLEAGERRYEEEYSYNRFLEVVDSLGLRTKARARLLLEAADLCADDVERERLKRRAKALGQEGQEIEDICANYRLQSALISVADDGFLGTLPPGGNGGLAAPPPLTKRFSQEYPVLVTEQVKEGMVRMLEGTFVRHGHGWLALRAFGLDGGPIDCYPIWLGELYPLTVVTRFLVGQKSVRREQDEMGYGGCRLPAGEYGNGVKIMTCGKGCSHWSVVTSLFRDKEGNEISSASLRSIAAREHRDRREVEEMVLSLFYPLIFDTETRKPYPFGLYRPLEGD